MDCSQIPMKTELGIFAGEMGIYFVELGNKCEEAGRKIQAGRASGFRPKGGIEFSVHTAITLYMRPENRPRAFRVAKPGLA
jgi:hypothetical protein